MPAVRPVTTPPEVTVTLPVPLTVLHVAVPAAAVGLVSVIEEPTATLAVAGTILPADGNALTVIESVVVALPHTIGAV